MFFPILKTENRNYSFLTLKIKLFKHGSKNTFIIYIEKKFSLYSKLWFYFEKSSYRISNKCSCHASKVFNRNFLANTFWEITSRYFSQNFNEFSCMKTSICLTFCLYFDKRETRTLYTGSKRVIPHYLPDAKKKCITKWISIVKTVCFILKVFFFKLLIHICIHLYDYKLINSKNLKLVYIYIWKLSFVVVKWLKYFENFM